MATFRGARVRLTWGLFSVVKLMPRLGFPSTAPGRACARGFKCPHARQNALRGRGRALARDIRLIYQPAVYSPRPAFVGGLCGSARAAPSRVAPPGVLSDDSPAAQDRQGQPRPRLRIQEAPRGVPQARPAGGPPARARRSLPRCGSLRRVFPTGAVSEHARPHARRLLAEGKDLDTVLKEFQASEQSAGAAAAPPVKAKAERSPASSSSSGSGDSGSSSAVVAGARAPGDAPAWRVVMRMCDLRHSPFPARIKRRSIPSHRPRWPRARRRRGLHRSVLLRRQGEARRRAAPERCASGFNTNTLHRRRHAVLIFAAAAVPLPAKLAIAAADQAAASAAKLQKEIDAANARRGHPLPRIIHQGAVCPSRPLSLPEAYDAAASPCDSSGSRRLRRPRRR